MGGYCLLEFLEGVDDLQNFGNCPKPTQPATNRGCRPVAGGWGGLSVGNVFFLLSISLSSAGLQKDMTAFVDFFFPLVGKEDSSHDALNTLSG